MVNYFTVGRYNHVTLFALISANINIHILYFIYETGCASQTVFVKFFNRRTSHKKPPAF